MNERKTFIRTAVLSATEILGDGHIVLDMTTGRPRRLYVGDGVTPVSQLEYFLSSEAAGGATSSDDVSNQSFVPGETVTDALQALRPIRITQSDAENAVDGSGTVVPKAGQQVQITNNGRVYTGNGTDTIAVIVAAGNYLVPATEL